MHQFPGEDLLIGAEAIAQFLFGSPEYRRRIYHLADKRELPIFMLGGRLCARRSSLIGAVEQRERAVTRGAVSAHAVA